MHYNRLEVGICVKLSELTDSRRAPDDTVTFCSFNLPSNLPADVSQHCDSILTMGLCAAVAGSGLGLRSLQDLQSFFQFVTLPTMSISARTSLINELMSKLEIFFEVSIEMFVDNGMKPPWLAFTQHGV